MQTRLSDAAYLDALDQSTGQVGSLAADLDPMLAVPSCPDWTVRDLLEHLGGVHAWARDVIAGGNPKAPKPLLEGNPADWYAARADEMCTAMRAVDPSLEAWTFRKDERRAGFWFRRQLHETEMHLLDLAIAAGVASDHPPEHAADGVTETFDVMVPRMNRDRPVAVSAPIGFSATDTGTSWLLRPSEVPAKVDYTLQEDISEATVVAAAPAHALLTALWRRTPQDIWQISGDREVLSRLMTSKLTP